MDSSGSIGCGDSLKAHDIMVGWEKKSYQALSRSLPDHLP
jgi:hypothetical protein